MDKFVEKPNLPEKTGLVLLGEKYSATLRKPLEQLGMTLMSVPANPKVDPRLSYHADLSLFHGGGNRVFVADCLKNTEIIAKFVDMGVFVAFCASYQAKNYPFDAALNVCCVGNYFIYSPKVSDAVIVSWLTKQGRVPVSCRQGYCKCSVCVVDENSVISSDKGISTACKMAGLDVLEIQPGFIDLDGFKYGFIGGASLKLSDDKLAFTGVLDAHPDKAKILDFLEIRGITPVFLTDKPVYDIGSAVILTEKEPKI